MIGFLSTALSVQYACENIPNGGYRIPITYKTVFVYYFTPIILPILIISRALVCVWVKSRKWFVAVIPVALKWKQKTWLI